MPIYRVKEKIVFFSHIPKTGGTSIEKVLRSAGQEGLYNKRRGQGFIVPPQHFDNIQMRYLFSDEKIFDYCFAVVRDPLNRMISEYFHRNRGILKESLFERIRGRITHECLELKFARHFDAWVDQSLNKWVNNRNYLSNHLTPQVDFIGGGFKIFIFENGFSSIVDGLSKDLNIYLPPITHENKSKRYPFEPNEQTKAVIREFYAADYDMFYPMSSS